MVEKFYLEDNETEKATSSLVKVNENLENLEGSKEKELSLEVSKLESNLEGLEGDIDSLGGEEGLQEQLDSNEIFKSEFLTKLDKMKYLIGSVVLPTAAGILAYAETKLDWNNVMDRDTGQTMTAGIVIALIGSALSIAKYLKESKNEKEEEFPN